DGHHRGHVGPVLDGTVVCGPLATYAGGPGAAARARPVEPIRQGGEHVELLGVLVLGLVVLPRNRSQHVHRDLVHLVAQAAELLRILEVDHQTSTAPSMIPMARRSRYHRSTGCSFT